jgi:hypothetical protein
MVAKITVVKSPQKKPDELLFPPPMAETGEWGISVSKKCME